MQNNNELHHVFAGRIPFILAGSLYIFEKSGKIQKLLHAIKYQNQKELAEFLGKIYAEDLLLATTDDRDASIRNMLEELVDEAH